VDLPSASPEEVTDDIVDLLGCKPEEVIPASAKTGIGIGEILEAIIERIPPPEGNLDEPLQALVFDSVYNPFRGVETYFRVINGEIKKGQKIKFVATGKDYFADEVGTLKLTQKAKPSIKAGDVGYLITGIKDAREVKVGDTITDAANPTKNAIAGFEDVKPMVFAGIYPVDTEDFEELRSSMEKLQLNDASLVFTPESSAALGFGFRCGFLGMLHMEIILT
jgi:GTP-binding protein LepA